MRAAAFLSKSQHGVYYARLVVPQQRLTPGSSREFRLSTGTKDPRAARVLARHLRVCFEQYLLDNALYRRSDAIKYLRAHMPKPTVQPMAFGVRRTADGYELTDLTPADAKALAAGDMDELLSYLDKQYNVAQSAPIADVSYDKPQAAHIAAVPHGQESPSDSAGAGAQTSLSQPTHAPSRSKLRIERLAREYLEYEEARAKNGELGPKKVPQIKTRLKPFLEHFAGRALNDLTTFDMEQYARALAFYPTFLDKLPAAAGLKFDAIIEKSKAQELLTKDGTPADTIAESTHDGYILAAVNFIDYCRRRNLAGHDLIEGLRRPVSSLRAGTKRRAFLKEELQQIFNSPYYRDNRYNSPYQYWIPLIGAFTGARVNEISQLQPSDVKQDNEGLWYFDITTTGDENEKSLKNEHSKRIVPIHQKLLDLGIVNYIKTKQAEKAANLFDLKRERADRFGRTPARWFNDKYLREYLKIEDRNVVFHSFRHRFITSLAQAILDASEVKGELIASTTPALILRRIVGHSELSFMTAGRSNDIHTDTYTGALSIRSMKRVIDLLDYPGVHFWKYNPPEIGKRKRLKSGGITDISGDELANIL